MRAWSSEKYDTVVVGAGPAGAEMAFRLAAEGVRVLLLERGELNREKPCGGGLQLQELVEFGDLPDSIVERKISRVRLASASGDVLSAAMDPAGLCSVTVKRSCYDRYLQQRAEQAGATVVSHARVCKVEHDGAGMAVLVRWREDNIRIETRLVINAAGAAGLRLDTGEPLVFDAMDVGVTYHYWLRPPRIGKDFRDAVELYYLKGIREGYAWIFPKKDVLSVGIGATAGEIRRTGLRLKAALDGFIRNHPIASSKLKGAVAERADGGLVPFAMPASLCGPGTIRLGDAAGLANIFHGGGIYHARKSALIAVPFCLAFLADGKQGALQQYDEQARSFFDSTEKKWDGQIRKVLWDPRIADPIIQRGRKDADIQNAVRIVLTSTESHQKAYQILEAKMIEIIYANLDAEARIYRKRLNAKLKTIFPGSSPLHQMANAILLNDTAKRLRACLGVLASDMFGGHRGDAVNFSLIYELFHTASLIHDDIMDDSGQRRSRESLHIKYGMANAIITGDLMLSKGYSLIAAFSRASRISKEQVVATLQIVGETGEQCCEGQTIDIAMAKNRDYDSIDTYTNMVGLKTGSLIEGALKAGAVIAGGSRRQVEDIADFGKSLGIAFQIIDDSLDLLGGERANKSVMNDLRQGKATPMLIHALSRATGPDREIIMQAVGNQQMGAEQVEAILQIYRRYGSITYAQTLSHRYVEQARRSLGKLPKGEAHDRLMAITDILDYWNLAGA
ncbi:MAG: geranylgeranyl reductase family protein [Kiritimatiellia bacterium]